MGWLEAMLLTAVLLIVAAASAAGGFWASSRQKTKRARGPFLLGLFCGLLVGGGLAVRRRGINAVAGSALAAVTRSLRAYRPVNVAVSWAMTLPTQLKALTTERRGVP